MTRIKELGKQLDVLADQIDAAMKPADAENRDLTVEETTKIEELEKQADEIQAAMEKQRKADDIVRRQIERKKFTDQPIVEIPRFGLHVEPHGLDIPTHVLRMKNLRGFSSPEDAYVSGHWCLATLFGRQESRLWLDRNGYEHLTQIGSDNVKGGYLVPEQFNAAIIDLREQYGTFRRKSDVAPMASDTATWPKRLTGLTVYWVGEETAITASDMTYGQVQLNARKLAALCKISSDLAEDAVVDISQRVATEIAYAFAVKEDQCGFLGTGASTYGGIVGLITACTTATATTVTAATGNTAFSTLDLADFEAMVGKLPEYPGIRPEWYISKAGWAASMMRLADAGGGVTAAEIEGRRQLMFLGYPVNLVQCMNTTLTAQTSAYGIAYFGDLAMAATLGDRRGIRMESSTERYFEYDQLAVKGTERFDIVVHSVGDTSSAGAMVMLAMPGS